MARGLGIAVPPGSIARRRHAPQAQTDKPFRAQPCGSADGEYLRAFFAHIALAAAAELRQVGRADALSLLLLIREDKPAL